MPERFDGQNELRRRRVEKGYSQDELAAILAKEGIRGERGGLVRQATISAWETIDGRRPATQALRAALHRLLGVAPDLWLSAAERKRLSSLSRLRRLPTQESPRKRAASRAEAS